MGRFLSMIQSDTSAAKQANHANETEELSDSMKRLEAAGVCIAIDKADQTAWLLFKPEDAEIVRHVATVHQPFEIVLTVSQRKELLDSLSYFETLQKRRTNSQ
jgi:hypothetical protein